MPDDKSQTQELVWLYRLKQAPLLVEESASDPFLRTGGYHTKAEDCPCVPWDECDCACHDYDGALGVLWVKTPVL